MTDKRRTYTGLYNKLFSIQKSYRDIAAQVGEQLSHFIPKTPEEVEKLDLLQDQIKTAYQNIDRIEEIKFFFNIVFLTDGSLIDEAEISTTILTIEALMQIAQDEINMDINEVMTSWAENKLTILNEVLSVFYQIFDHKIKRKINIGEIKYQ